MASPEYSHSEIDPTLSPQNIDSGSNTMPESPLSPRKTDQLTGMKGKIFAGTFAAANLAGALSGSSVSAEPNRFLYTGGSSSSCFVPEAEIIPNIENGSLAFFDYYPTGDSSVNPSNDSVENNPLIIIKSNPLGLEDCPPINGEIEKDKTQMSLDAWTTPNSEGKYTKVDIDKKFTRGLKYTILNKLDGTHFDFKYDVMFAAKLLSSEVVNGHLIVYAGVEDWYGKQYFVPLNAGKIDGNKVLYHWLAESDYPFSFLGTQISGKEMKKFVEKSKGDVIAFSALGSAYDIPGKQYNNYEKELAKQVKIARAFTLFSEEIAQNRVSVDEALANAPKNVQDIINMRVTSENFNLASLPMATGIIEKSNKVHLYK